MNIIKYLLCKNSGMSNGESFLRASTNMPISGGAAKVIEKTVPFTDIITVTDALARPAVDLQSEITATQNLNGYEYPWVGGAGKNKLPCEAEGLTINYIQFTVNDDGTITAKAVQSSETHNPAILNYGHITLPAGMYKVNGINNGGSSTFYIEFLKDAYNGTRIIYITNGDNTITLEEETDVYVRTIVATRGLLTEGDTVTYYPMIRLATESDATFAPYENICPITGYDEVNIYHGKTEQTATEYTVSLTQAGTVYGGVLDVTTGELTVDKVFIHPTSVTSIGTDSGKYFFRINLPITGKNAPDGYAICNMLARSATVAHTVGTFFITSYGTVLHITHPDQTLNSMALMNAYLENNVMEFVYELATPQTIALTPTEVMMLKNNNTIWADSGRVQLTYKARQQ